jgi:hypothetical protein
VAVIAERFEVRLAEGRTELGLAPAALGLPPGSVPVDAVRGAIRGYQAGVITGERLISIVDRHGDALERGIAHKAVESMTDFHRAIDRAALLAGQMSMRLAQLEWLRRFPAGPDRDPVQLPCSVKSTEAGVPAAGGTDRSRAPGEIRPGDHRRRAARVPQVLDVANVLDALRRTQLPARVATLAPPMDARAQRLDRRRGAGPVMAALADCGFSTTDVALELGFERRKTWSVLNGHERVPAGLQEALERLLGADQAAVVLQAIPEHPRGRAPASGAIATLHAAGARVEDIAPLIPARPATVRKWLRGTLAPGRRNTTALAGALDQLLGKATAARVLELIPNRSGHA